MYNTQELQQFRYAQIQSSILNKTSMSSNSSSGSSKINLKGKFGVIEQNLTEIESELRKLTNDTNESMRYAKQIGTDVADRELTENKNKLGEEVRKLDKNVKYGITESQRRCEKIWVDCRNRIKATENLKNTMNNLRDRITRLENTLGFHSVSENVI